MDFVIALGRTWGSRASIYIATKDAANVDQQTEDRTKVLENE